MKYSKELLKSIMVPVFSKTSDGGLALVFNLTLASQANLPQEAREIIFEKIGEYWRQAGFEPLDFLSKLSISIEGEFPEIDLVVSASSFVASLKDEVFVAAWIALRVLDKFLQLEKIHGNECRLVREHPVWTRHDSLFLSEN